VHFIVTRPEADAEALQAPLEAMGHRVSLAPMLTISFPGTAPLDVTGCAALIATSRNGLRALEIQRDSLSPEVWQIPLFAVGPGSAALARSMGFAEVVEGPANAAALVPLLAVRFAGQASVFTHLSGDAQAFDLKAALVPLGFELRQLVLYRSNPATVLPGDILTGLAQNSFDAVILMSPQTAQTFVKVVAQAGLTDGARKLDFLCLSSAVESQLMAWQPVRAAIAAKPNLEEILVLASQATKQFR